jgi:hypothetical protein
MVQKDRDHRIPVFPGQGVDLDSHISRRWIPVFEIKTKIHDRTEGQVIQVVFRDEGDYWRDPWGGIPATNHKSRPSLCAGGL